MWPGLRGGRGWVGVWGQVGAWARRVEEDGAHCFWERGGGHFGACALVLARVMTVEGMVVRWKGCGGQAGCC
jgi:hypothetical protein